MDELRIPTRDELESYLVSMIEATYRAAREAAKPYVDELVRLRMRDPPAPIFLAKEQLDALAPYLPKHD